jgi:hypothetical protein
LDTIIVPDARATADLDGCRVLGDHRPRSTDQAALREDIGPDLP